MNNYIPIGTLKTRLNAKDAHYLEFQDWKDIKGSWLAFEKYDIGTKGEKLISLAKRLADQNWIKVHAVESPAEDLALLRIYVLPEDVGRRHVERNTPVLRKALFRLIHQLDTSRLSWKGLTNIATTATSKNEIEDSLFYIYNTLPSPPVGPASVSCPATQEALRSIFDPAGIPGLKAQLYPYQKRSVAAMIRREVQPAKTLDPRLQVMKGPTGVLYYSDSETCTILKDPRNYDEPNGGILGESMGLGKTLICLATILATKGHWPAIPPQFSTDPLPVRAEVGSLLQMAAAAAGRSQVPWRAILQDMSRAGEDHAKCLDILEENVGSYIISGPETRQSRRPSVARAGKTFHLSTATLIITPQNLLDQWKSEINSHIEKNHLAVLYLADEGKVAMPPSKELQKYDIVLMSRQVFEKEMVPSATKNEYQSPLKDLHFLRIILDEGHDFASSGHKGSLYWAIQQLHVDRKWICSGTPASGLIGVEVGSASFETTTFNHEEAAHEATSRLTNKAVLDARRKESALVQERKDLEKLGLIVAGFLQIKPWSNSKEQDPASWQKYIMPDEKGRRKPHSLRKLLESLVVRHQIEDVEADISLPPLHNRVVYLQPSFHDKLSINLFILNLTANALTSERVDEDYMFHPKNRRELNSLIQNLRQSCFYWTGFSFKDIEKTLRLSREYFEQHGRLSAENQIADKLLMENAIQVGDIALNNIPWTSIVELHEMGILVEDFPNQASTAWSLLPHIENRPTHDPLLVGASQLLKAQSWMDSHLYASDPPQELAKVGQSTMRKARQDAQLVATETPGARDSDESHIVKSQTSKKSATSGDMHRLTEKITVSRPKAGLSPRKSRKSSSDNTNTQESINGSPLKSALKQPISAKIVSPFDADSDLAKSKICGTASAKLSYLLDRVAILHKDEKILIFYENDNVAYYISQALDLLGIRYLIYTRSLKQERQNAYITTFNTTETFRVLVMNVHLAAHGLHIASASRVFFVNPVWQPNVEAQAIKRAHRIGQTRPVYVETLVLEDTLEHQMLQRRKRMTTQEHQKAEKSLLDDDTMSTLIKRAQFLPFADVELNNLSKQFARLDTPQQLFARAGRGGGSTDDPDADLVFPANLPSAKKRKQRRRASMLPEVGDFGSKGPSSERLVGGQIASSAPLSSVEVLPLVGTATRLGLSSHAEASSMDSTRGVAFAEDPPSLFGGGFSRAFSS
ncbi:hypothetical protein MMC21_002591 [Puttea exsequens]|nr:hypothetical protein [Puttea exsequens]